MNDRRQHGRWERGKMLHLWKRPVFEIGSWFFIKFNDSIARKNNLILIDPLFGYLFDCQVRKRQTWNIVQWCVKKCWKYYCFLHRLFDSYNCSVIACGNATALMQIEFVPRITNFSHKFSSIISLCKFQAEDNVTTNIFPIKWIGLFGRKITKFEVL